MKQGAKGIIMILVNIVIPNIWSTLWSYVPKTQANQGKTLLKESSF